MKRIFEILWVLFEKSVNLYFDWPKSWIWRTLEQITNNFSKWHFHNASKKVFRPQNFWTSCTGSKVPFWQNGKIAKTALLNPCMKFKFFFARDFFCVIMKVPYTMVQGLPNPGLRSVKVQTETFLKKDSRDFKNSFYLGFLWIPSKPGKQN